jgi:hypothetical protein
MNGATLAGALNYNSIWRKSYVIDSSMMGHFKLI